jgi:hypothetical protein
MFNLLFQNHIRFLFRRVALVFLVGFPYNKYTLLIYHSVVYSVKRVVPARRKGVVYEFQRISSVPSEIAENAKTIVRTSGDLPQGDSEFRTGVAKGPCAHRASGVLLTLHAEEKGEGYPALLGGPKLFDGKTPRLPGVGIGRRQSLLVYQWDHLRGKTTKQLEQQD